MNSLIRGAENAYSGDKSARQHNNLRQKRKRRVRNTLLINSVWFKKQVICHAQLRENGDVVDSQTLPPRCLFHRPSVHPARVVFIVESVSRKTRPPLPPISLVIHSVKRQRPDRIPGSHMEIRILVPTVDINKKFPNSAWLLWRQ